ncbi:MAG: hypothetical protein KF768_06585 [Phycisphaeraceae bacterium]|nr:hypothetical protein [Phycisphaeraceae bacterium]
MPGLSATVRVRGLQPSKGVLAPINQAICHRPGPLICCAAHSPVRPVCPPASLGPLASEHRPFHEHLASEPHSGYGGALELWRLLARLNHLAREAERVQTTFAQFARIRGSAANVSHLEQEASPANEVTTAQRLTIAFRPRRPLVQPAFTLAYSGRLSPAGRMVDVLL